MNYLSIYHLTKRTQSLLSQIIYTHILDQKRWQAIVQYEDSLWREVERDGVPILVPAASTLVH